MHFKVNGISFFWWIDDGGYWCLMCCSLGRLPSLQRVTGSSHLLLVVFFASVLKSRTNRRTLALQDACNDIDLSGWCSHPARKELGPPLNPVHGEVGFSPNRHISPVQGAWGFPELAAPEDALHCILSYICISIDKCVCVCKYIYTYI